MGVWVWEKASDQGCWSPETCRLFDISASRRDQERLQQSEERYRLFTELASDYVYVADMTQPQPGPEVVAGSFERITGYRAHEIAALGGWPELMHPDDRAADAPRLFEAVRAGRTFVHEYRIITKSGEIRWLRDRARPITDPATGEGR